MTQPVVYVATHPDDAFLFRGDALYTDLHTSGVQVHLIVPDAGDLGRTDGWWQTREAAIVQGVKATLDVQRVSVTSPIINGHPVRHYTGNNFSIWCMRLPDGNLDGAGFADHGSLTALQAGTISSLAPVDGTAAYTSFDDVTATLEAIIARARGTAAHMAVNASDPDRTINPGDHPDHYAVADALASFASADGLKRVWWVSYQVQNLPANVTGLSLDQKRLLFSAYGWATGVSPNDTEWSWWGPRSYFRIDKS